MKDYGRILKPVSAALLIIVAAVFLWCFPDKEDASEKYYINQGYIFGTYYNIRYEASADLENDILAELARFDRSLSTFNDSSVISRINKNENVLTDAYFDTMYATAQRIAQQTHGAFDITVAPLVNVWGFGFRNKEQVTPSMIDSLLTFVGYKTISLSEHRLQKTDERTMLDASAIAKGQACDVVAALLQGKGLANWLVDIGGEVVCQGLNDKGELWKVGITKPQDDTSGTQNELQEVIASTSLCMATSGNYRQFYYENGIKRSHTIDPRTGYPVNHSLLSATVIASSCMEADALATTCMVLGADSALMLIEQLPDVACYLICAEGDSLTVRTNQRMKNYLSR
ncbi:MAG: FAD:protein FMN transferase [Paludibacter sp.]|nr:FAD:protein FMN transferase [Bacteroidales bacterium]MCM1069300.1 FAD:protein FMN transferase [Prevotella sp.]MCM1353717.1 FAD:protein FMN transferase [Bacteroides sp.]MCM1442215.1 FAD:protein FMN transferase [Muribaculum sp.]MCM1482177.1 FAD:protein FMN transferase [Paludibacter sp.]